MGIENVRGNSERRVTTNRDSGGWKELSRIGPIPNVLSPTTALNGGIIEDNGERAEVSRTSGAARLLSVRVARFVQDRVQTPWDNPQRRMPLDQLEERRQNAISLVREPVTTIAEAVANHTQLMNELTHPDVAKVMQVVEGEMESQYNTFGFTGAGLVLVGSGASGGMLVRDALGTYVQPSSKNKPADLDLVFYSGRGPTPTRDQYAAIDKKVRKIVDEIPNVRLSVCDYINPYMHHRIPPSVDHLVELFTWPNLSYSGLHNLHSHEYLLPSYPKTVSTHNLTNFLSALTITAQESGESRWAEVTGIIRSEARDRIRPTREKFFDPFFESSVSKSAYRELIVSVSAKAVDEQVSKILAVTGGKMV